MNRIDRATGLLGALLLLGACADSATTSQPASQAASVPTQIVGFGPRGTPEFITGLLAKAPAPASWTRPEVDLAPALRDVTPLFGLSPSELSLRTSWLDELGFGHAIFDRTINGLPVVGSELRVHADQSGAIYAANGEGFVGIDLPAQPAISEADARAIAVAGPGSRSVLESRLVYAIPARTGEAHLAWELRVEGHTEGGSLLAERVYVDALSRQVVDRHPLVYGSKNRKVYDPDTLRRSEGQAPYSDAEVNHAYDNTGLTYDCYWSWFQRDSWNAQGGQLVSRVHHPDVYNNAAWYQGEMLFGDGDGQTLGDLAAAFDVTAHEITHGVTENTANLTYENESGALNEAWSDIMAAACEAYTDGGTPNANTWKIGEDVYTPGTSGDALRYMNNPTQDGQSYDYWPERMLLGDNEQPDQNNNDLGGVHLNSGIANLAFYLAVQGGHHPRNKTTINVTAAGIRPVANAYYRALTTYLTASSSFQSARIATVQAASDLQTRSAAQSIDNAWAAVGVPPTLLNNGVAVTPLTGNAYTRLYFALEVPAGSTNLVIRTTGNSGDCDLYVKLGSTPTSQSYDYKSEGQTTAETVTVPSPGAGTWYVLVSGYSNFTGTQIVASFETHRLTPPEKPTLPPPSPSL
jgi:vibriolysin